MRAALWIIIGKVEYERDYDPWYEVEVARFLGAIHMRRNNSMVKGKIVAELDPVAFAPYSFLKWEIKWGR